MDTPTTATLQTMAMTPLHASLERARRGERPSVGQWLEFPGYHLARTVASFGEDWVLIDTEHGAISDSDMLLMVQAIASSTTCSPVVRIPGAGEHWMLKRALDAGAHAVMVPMVETREQAEMVVRACRYPSLRTEPQTDSNSLGGNRGAGAMFAHHAFPASHSMSANGVEYWKGANHQVLVIAQIESATAVENIEAIASTPGLDALFIGPNDLAGSMGFVPFEHAQHEEVQAAIAKVLEVGKRHGKWMGCFALGAEEAGKRWEQGWDFVNCGADLIALAKWMGGEMGRLREIVGEGRRG